MNRHCQPVLVGLLSFAAAPIQAQQPQIQVPDNVVLDRDIEYGRVGDHVLRLDLARPIKPSRDRLPVIVYIHGGGWAGGDKAEAWRRGLLSLAGSGNYAVASINYRLSGVATWPACIHDCKAAIRWVRAHANKYNFDPERVAAWGHSAGGHLTALLATSGGVKDLEGTGPHLDQSSRITCGIDEAGPTDFVA